MSRRHCRPHWWSWAVGAITVVVALFWPHIGGLPVQAQGFFWQLYDEAPRFSLVQALLNPNPFFMAFVALPLCALTACMIWLWSVQMYWDPTVGRALLVTLEATGLAVLATTVGSGVLFMRPGVPGNGGGRMALTLYSAMFAFQAFLSMLPCLLLATALLARLQRHYQEA